MYMKFGEDGEAEVTGEGFDPLARVFDFILELTGRHRSVSNR